MASKKSGGKKVRGRKAKNAAPKKPVAERIIEKLFGTISSFKESDYKEKLLSRNFAAMTSTIDELKSCQVEDEPCPTTGDLGSFEAWLETNGIPKPWKFNFITDASAGNGVGASGDLTESSPITTVPSLLMMSTETALKSELGPLILKDSFLQAKPSVTLALHLLIEREKGGASFFAPYINILPNEYVAIAFHLLNGPHIIHSDLRCN